jgi:phage tail sheath protein FI
MDAFANRNMTGTPTDKTNYVFNSIRQAIDSIADPEVVEMNMATIPGLTQEGLTTNLVRLCEDRADALAVIDLPDAFQPREEGDAVDRLNIQSTITTIVNGLRTRNLNSSYGCAYYPWLRARDTINGAFIWVPPSVAAIGTFSSSQRKTQVWFAPAGFNRGGLTEGSAGIPIVDVAHQLRRKDRDDLYASNVNPIAKFPNEGIVIFGQKTLQITPSALDRINVRRLMIFVKKRISQMAARLLFDPNVQQTWLRFKAQVDPFLANVKTNFGLSDYKVVLDETTTTPDLVDQNIMYAKIFLKPTRAIEYIAIDFNITRTGASFDD